MYGSFLVTMADAMLSKTDAKFLKKGLSGSNDAKGKNHRMRKVLGNNSRSKNEDTSSRSWAKILSSGKAGTVNLRPRGLSPNTSKASKEPTWADVSSNIQQEKEFTKKLISCLSSQW